MAIETDVPVEPEELPIPAPVVVADDTFVTLKNSDAVITKR